MEFKVGDKVVWIRNMNHFEIIADKKFLLSPEEFANFPKDENVFVIKNEYSAFRANSRDLRIPGTILN